MRGFALEMGPVWPIILVYVKMDTLEVFVWSGHVVEYHITKVMYVVVTEHALVSIAVRARVDTMVVIVRAGCVVALLIIRVWCVLDVVIA
ncbi:hypothetical protein AKO1_015209 [Acrasis kona]|uniref:Uncharacterized protein n=1 Tax=Acrasis kona TaxID=1008807 RepID=A0AAW2YK78_9EUKA